ncbi:carboxymuconolactone decarboxylase family protein [Chamaesiphon sp. VAR_48_metabat_403]|uniref:carboxymuconolactone decarboxylase family protein n=1 Tax=Chamaesiphon sp. VAR_48_metabat_403 TaxID=2964700 RepID=UPI00286D846C|nr:carboxymuconolactone decarboxylase family protein [Chamaesiphon sp. VAR_48_metabat_403]
MSTFNPIDPKTADTNAKAALDLVEAAFGGIPNLMKMLAIAPNVLKGVMAFNQEVTGGELETSLVEQVALLASGINQCEYCVAVHVHVGQQAGLSRDELICNLQGESSDPKSQAVLNFTRAVVNNRGQVDPSLVNALRDQGLSDKAIIEIVGVIGLYTFLNYIKHLTKPTLDFPAVEEFQRNALV